MGYPTLDEKHTQVMAKMDEVAAKCAKVRECAGLILWKTVFEGQVLEWPPETEAIIDGYYETAKAELKVLVGELP